MLKSVTLSNVALYYTQSLTNSGHKITWPVTFFLSSDSQSKDILKDYGGSHALQTKLLSLGSHKSVPASWDVSVI